MRRFHIRRDEAGASAVEYGLLIAGVAALIVFVVFAFGGMVNHVFGNSCSSVSAKVSPQTTCS